LTLLSTQKISKSYDKSDFILNDISFQLNPGEILSLVGPNGSGKSTLLSIISGNMDAESGQVLLDGEKVEGPKSKLIAGHEEIKLVFQDYGLKPSMTVYENIRYQLLDYSEDFKKERLETVLGICNLTELQSRKPREISGGQQQRVALANALATDPKVLLMDEPFSNLDPYTKADILQALQDIAKKTNTAIIIVTHDPSDSLMVADKIAFLEKGNLIQLDSPEGIYYHPSNIKIGKFFGYLSVLSPNSCREFSITLEKGNVCIRAEDIRLSSTGMKFKVLNSIWKGHYRVLVLEQEGFDPLLAFDYSNSVNKNDIVKVELDKSAIINILPS